MIIIRNEKESDYKAVEEITREAFYNLYVPGCVEHYLVHIMRQHEDFIPELDFVIELSGQVIGNAPCMLADIAADASITDSNSLKRGAPCRRESPRFTRLIL